MPLHLLSDAGDAEALRFGERALTYDELRGAAAAVADRVHGAERVAVWAMPELETCVAVVGALVAGAAVVPINPKAGEHELGHIASDSRPDVVLAPPGTELPPALAELARADVRAEARGGGLPPEPSAESPALIVYTSGTTGPPKGAVLPHRAIASNLDALASAWEWTAEDRLVHGLPLFHVHGLVLGVLGPLRRGGALSHVGRFSSEAIAEALERGATMMFGVPTMYHRLAADCERSPRIAGAVRRARLLVSGSAALAATDHQRIEQATGRRILERYGMTETLMNTAMRTGGAHRPGYVGPPVDGVRLRLLDDDGNTLDVSDDETFGEIAVAGPNLFLGYRNRPDATAEAVRDGWFHTGDLATRAADGSIRIVGRRATDLIKSGGYKIGAGEIENAMLEHPAVGEVAVTGEPDDDLGERIVAWVVRAGEASPEELARHVAALLAPHKRPRDVRFVAELPRNELGKVKKRDLMP
jgi:malonyl-CoA/methylmalonyl-CoA synthetase